MFAGIEVYTSICINKYTYVYLSIYIYVYSHNLATILPIPNSILRFCVRMVQYIHVCLRVYKSIQVYAYINILMSIYLLYIYLYTHNPATILPIPNSILRFCVRRGGPCGSGPGRAVRRDLRSNGRVVRGLQVLT